ncbi:MAG: hypothetical protein ACOWWM_01495 [Desulfobacterales bacterium]
MEIMSQKILNMVFKRNVPDDMSSYEMDLNMLKVLGKIDGVSDVATVSSRLGMPPIELRPILARLYNQRLILPTTPAGERLDPGVLAFMEKHLATSIGPVAAMIIGDSIRQLGEQPQNFPAARAGELVEKIASKIIVDSHKHQFLQLMNSKLAKKEK